MRSFLIAASFLLLSFASWGQAEDYRLASADLGRLMPTLDSLVGSAIQDIRASNPDAALANVDRLIAMRPDFKLAHLLKGDLLQVKAGTIASFGPSGKPATSKRAELNDLKEEARVRLLRYIDQPDPGRLPKQILQLAPGQRYALLADASRARLYIFENIEGEPRLVRDFYVSIGRNGIDKRTEGDKKTPTGVYTMTSELPRKRLTSFYGAGAYPLDYPNEWDSLLGNSGHGIWLHGVPPNTYSRPPKASEGCLVVANPDYQEISRYIRPHTTPIVIAERTEWLDRVDWLAVRHELLNALEAWRVDWQRQDVDAYLDHYNESFLKSAGRGWVDSKRRNISQKNWIRVQLSDINLFMYPASDLAVVNFTQDYDSDKHKDTTRKRFYLKLDQGRWRIALEKNAGSIIALASTHEFSQPTQD